MLEKLIPASQTAGDAPGESGGVEGEVRSLADRVHDVLHARSTLGPAIVLVLAVIGFSVTTDRFLDPANLSLIVQQVIVIGTLAAAQTIIILTAGIDLSVGAIMVLSSIVMAKLSAEA